jgi:mRNA-degrading endonuclease RelE of RelBE toxin-antitoxin system
MFAVRMDQGAYQELQALRTYDARQITTAIRRSLTSDPLAEGGAQKRLLLDDGSEVRQLRVGDFRVFYTVDEDARVVTVTAIRRKGTRTTGEIL